MSHDVHQVRSFEHPGEGRKRAKATPKGRQVDPTAAHEIEQLLGDRPRRDPFRAPTAAGDAGRAAADRRMRTGIDPKINKAVP